MPSLRVGTMYADNPRLLADSGTSSEGAVGEFNASLKRSTARSELTLRPRLLSSRYSDDETLDSDDQLITAGYRWLGERSQWNTDIGFTRDTTLTSELGLTGLVQSNRRHEAGTFTVAPTVMFTERVNGGAQMYVVNNHYIDADNTGLVDYRYMALSLFSTVTLTDAGSSLTLTAQGGELTTSGLFGAETRDGTLRLGWSFQPWLLWTASLSVGPSVVETKDANDSGIVFDGDIKRQGDRWSLAANAGRSQSPTGRGVLTQRDQVGLTFNSSLTERLSVNVATRWIRSEDLLPQRGRTRTYEVDYGSLSLGASWRLARDWSISLQLTGNTQNYDLSPDRANGYRASLNVVWNGQPQFL